MIDCSKFDVNRKYNAILLRRFEFIGLIGPIFGESVGKGFSRKGNSQSGLFKSNFNIMIFDVK